MIRTLLAVLALAAVASAQETAAPSIFPSGGSVCGPLPMAVECWSWLRFPTPVTALQTISRCWSPDTAPWWAPEGDWDRVCHEHAEPGQACIAQWYVFAPRRAFCDAGLWAP